VLADDHGLASAIKDGVVVLDPDGRIAWANEAFARLLRRDLADLIGADGFGFVHPDEQARALDGIVYAGQFPDRTSVAPYRILRGDGLWIPLELKSGLIERNGSTHVVLVVRDGTNRSNVNRALLSVANGSAGSAATNSESPLGAPRPMWSGRAFNLRKIWCGTCASRCRRLRTATSK